MAQLPSNGHCVWFMGTHANCPLSLWAILTAYKVLTKLMFYESWCWTLGWTMTTHLLRILCISSFHITRDCSGICSCPLMSLVTSWPSSLWLSSSVTVWVGVRRWICCEWLSMGCAWRQCREVVIMEEVLGISGTNGAVYEDFGSLYLNIYLLLFVLIVQSLLTQTVYGNMSVNCCW